MINIDIVNKKIKLESKVIELKLALAQKEDKSYTEFIQDPLNSSMVKSAKDKIISQIKQEDTEWLEMESDLSIAEISLKALNIRYETLQNMIRAMSNPNAGVDLSLFDKIQEQYLTGLEGL